jgi:hypothetical protein
VRPLTWRGRSSAVGLDLRSFIQRLVRMCSSAIWRTPESSELLAEFSWLVERDGNQNILGCLEIVLTRYLKRSVVVMLTEGPHSEAERNVPADGAWRMSRSDIAACLDSWPKSEATSSRLARAFGQDSAAANRIAVLVPVVSQGGSSAALLVVGKKWTGPLTESECTLVAAAAGMATLLLEQVLMRDRLHFAEALGKTAEQMLRNRQRGRLFSDN